jgi:hypothetical protein
MIVKYVYLFIYGLFNNAVSSSDNIALNVRVIKNNRLENMRTDAVMA